MRPPSVLRRLQAAEAEVERLREALEPFAKMADCFLAAEGGECIVTRSNFALGVEYMLTVAELFRARQALQEPGR